MDTTPVLRSSDLERIDAIACKAIIEYFKAKDFTYSSYDVEEALAGVHERLAKSWANYDPERSKSSYFVRMARNCACDVIRREANWRLHRVGMQMTTTDGEVYELDFADRECPEVFQADYQVLINEEMDEVEREIDTLGFKTALALRLDAMGYSRDEIMERLDCSYNSVSGLLFRGRKLLKQKLHAA
ncbi:MAG: sigma-70 family RNA polymerase sigma factor [Bacteroidales bacterium]|jgi:RNA polymerase sigma factor (sigma-70 family)|nr:sigma-70 family RNA polymerase sigma factor [Bacteroidales bacterium]